MSNLFNQNIEYKGINKYISNNMENFAQFNVSYIFQIGSENKDILNISKVEVKSDVTYFEVINTPKGISLEGQCLTGKKMILCGDLNFKIEYISDGSNQNIEVRHTKVPISVCISIDNEDYDFIGLYPSFSIEDIYCRKENNKDVYINVTLVGIVDVY